ncbi:MULTISPECIES: hypothetical protein [Gammaproteobacteria]|uniref:hypothetical protein n=1 Tax=Gammaproteobacteria TaxID=1236 RepID=UPI003A8ED2E1
MKLVTTVLLMSISLSCLADVTSDGHNITPTQTMAGDVSRGPINLGTLSACERSGIRLAGLAKSDERNVSVDLSSPSDPTVPPLTAMVGQRTFIDGVTTPLALNNNSGKYFYFKTVDSPRGWLGTEKNSTDVNVPMSATGSYILGLALTKDFNPNLTTVSRFNGVKSDLFYITGCDFAYVNVVKNYPPEITSIITFLTTDGARYQDYTLRALATDSTSHGLTYSWNVNGVKYTGNDVKVSFRKDELEATKVTIVSTVSDGSLSATKTKIFYVPAYACMQCGGGTEPR